MEVAQLVEEAKDGGTAEVAEDAAVEAAVDGNVLVLAHAVAEVAEVDAGPER